MVAFGRHAVATVVLGIDDIATAGQESRELLVPAAVLGHAVEDVDDSDELVISFRLPDPVIDLQTVIGLEGMDLACHTVLLA